MEGEGGGCQGLVFIELDYNLFGKKGWRELMT